MDAVADRQAERRAMVGAISSDVRATSWYLGQETLGSEVLGALSRVPRHEFVPEASRANAYENRPLPIGHGQTISQPYIVAIMTELLNLAPDHRVLEVGTGSGYQAAVLAELVDQVFSIEIIPPLAESAKDRFRSLAYTNISTRNSDGYYGWPEAAPFDAIIVTAAAGHVPPPLLEQLAAGGRMIIPVGSRFTVQQLLLIEKRSDGTVVSRSVLPVRFVPLTGDHG
jgi:protein-L-isoaspartate(D-aspartate) O-methyltransferase